MQDTREEGARKLVSEKGGKVIMIRGEEDGVLGHEDRARALGCESCRSCGYESGHRRERERLRHIRLRVQTWILRERRKEEGKRKSASENGGKDMSGDEDRVLLCESSRS